MGKWFKLDFEDSFILVWMKKCFLINMTNIEHDSCGHLFAHKQNWQRTCYSVELMMMYYSDISQLVYCKRNEKSLNKWNIRRKYCSKYVENSWNWCCGVLNIRTFIYFPWCHSEGWNLKKITHPQSTHTYGRREHWLEHLQSAWIQKH